MGLLLRRCSGKGLHLAMTGEPRGFSRITAGFSSYDGEFRLPLVLAQASPSLVNGKGEILPAVAADFVNGPAKPASYIGKVASLLYTRYQNGATLWLWGCLPKPGAPGP